MNIFAGQIFGPEWFVMVGVVFTVAVFILVLLLYLIFRLLDKYKIFKSKKVPFIHLLVISLAISLSVFGGWLIFLYF